jgi:MoaA/NifB/PqqE/SkfB family radical SAM enzyme
MDFAQFTRLVPYFSEVEKVVLEGWGESLLHPDLADAIRLVKSQGAEAGFVTSGYGLDYPRAEELVRAGVDFIGFSLAGASASVHESIRVNSRLTHITAALQYLREAKKRLAAVNPRVHLIYLMLEDNIHEVPQLPSQAREMGVTEVILTNLIQMSTSQQAAQAVFTCGEKPEKEYAALIAAALLKAKENGVVLKAPGLIPEEVAVCAENPLENVYIDTTGEVSPCVYLYPPVNSPFTRIFCGQKTSQEKLSFGNIFQEPWAAIWNREAYRDFRAVFTARNKAGQDWNERILNPGGSGRHDSPSLPDFPSVCATCHKRLGV